ncbi:STAS domain-containing protein [Actinoplanes sp. NPDC051859]|uniref:STAS domain-containing protein n=1 Tax=Actinoplanes sp. NPDC051859 TaxID=3363909 RepID=UPI0037B07025
MDDEVQLWRYELRRDGATSTVELAGELDLQCADEVRFLLTEQAGIPGVSTVVLDLERVSFLDSTVLGCFISGYYAAQKAGRVLTIVNPSEAALRVLRITGLLTLLAPA